MKKKISTKLFFFAIIVVVLFYTFSRNTVEGFERCYLPDYFNKKEECKKLTGTTVIDDKIGGKNRCYLTDITREKDCSVYKRDDIKRSLWWDPYKKKK